MNLRSVCVFCGSKVGGRAEYAEAAAALGLRLARDGTTVVYGGGSVGLMGTVANAALAAEGHVIGVIPQALATKELAHAGVTELRVVPSMHTRKAMMADLADAFVALPGGFGTFEELFEIVTWAQLGIHAKPIGLLNVAGYYDHLLALIDHAAAEGFIHPDNRGLVLAASSPDDLITRLAAYRPPVVPPWVTREET
jgi:uncharacterized protein (TIGR00730 family)